MFDALTGGYGLLLLRQSPSAFFVVNVLFEWWMGTIRGTVAFFEWLGVQRWLAYLIGKRAEVGALLAGVQLQVVAELAMIAWFAVDWIIVHSRFWMLSMKTADVKPTLPREVYDM